ncbi:MAG: diguanylate cyclase [Cetobacterium sp.]
MKKISYIIFGYVLIYSFIVFFYKGELRRDTIEILSITVSLFIVWASYLKYKKATARLIFWKILFIGFCLNFVSNILHIVSEKFDILEIMNGRNILFLLVYIFMLLAIYYFLYETIGHLNICQLLVDSIIMIGFSLSLISKLFLKKFEYNFACFNYESNIILIFMILNFLILIGAFTIYQINIKTKILKKASLIRTLGFLIYTISDLGYTYTILKKQNIGECNPLFEFLWQLGLIIVVFSGLYEVYNIKRNFRRRVSIPENLGIRFPMGMIFLYVLILSLNFRNITIVFIATLIIVLRIFLTKHVNIYVTNEYLYKSYKDIGYQLTKKMEEISNLSLYLEKIVYERNIELSKKNIELNRLANIDCLTNLPNRRNCLNFLDNLISTKKSDGEFILIFIDLDRFKSINDWYGHDIGDKVLLEFVKRLKNYLSPIDFLARLSGDEFIVIIDNIGQEKIIKEMACQIIKLFQNPFVIGENKIICTLSIGISMYPKNSQDRLELMKYGDIALNSAKEDGKNRAKIYNKEMEKQSLKNLELENKIYRAIEKNEFKIYYRPQMSLENMRISSIHAVIRWKNDELGFISSEVFNRIAEESGIIIEVGEYIIDKLGKEIKYLKEKYKEKITVGISVSPKQFHAGDIVGTLKKTMKKYDIEGERIEIGITESCSIKNEEKTLERLKELKHIGITVILDKFGIGYSSFNNLKVYPLDSIKISKKLINNIESNQEDYNILKTVVEIGKTLNLDIIAEGLNDLNEVKILKNLGCGKIEFIQELIPLKTLEEKYLEI